MFFKELTPRNDGYRVVEVLSEHFEYLCEAIRKELQEVCFGKYIAKNKYAFSTYKDACEEITRMLDRKGDSKKIGFVGELLMHLIVPHVFGFRVESASVLLSMSNINIKHGFDINYLDYDNETIWYGETKSTASRKRKEIIKDAKDDLCDYFFGINGTAYENTRKKWRTALTEAMLVYNAEPDKLAYFNRIFDKSKCEILKGHSRNALLMVVNFGESKNNLEDTQDIEAALSAIRRDNIFDKCLIISVGRELFLDILDFIEMEAKA